MGTLKKMLCKLLSRTLSMKEFENWLYYDDFIKSQIVKNDVIFELVSIDLRSKDAFVELEKFCFKHFNKEECLVKVVKYNCENLLETKTDDALESFFQNICYFHDWDLQYALIEDVYYLLNDWELTHDGYMDKRTMKNEVRHYAEIVLEKLNALNSEESVQLLINGFEIKTIIPEQLASKDNKTIETNLTSKKWFQFWK